MGFVSTSRAAVAVGNSSAPPARFKAALRCDNRTPWRGMRLLYGCTAAQHLAAQEGPGPGLVRGSGATLEVPARNFGEASAVHP